MFLSANKDVWAESAMDLCPSPLTSCPPHFFSLTNCLSNCSLAVKRRSSAFFDERCAAGRRAYQRCRAAAITSYRYGAKRASNSALSLEARDCFSGSLLLEIDGSRRSYNRMEKRCESRTVLARLRRCTTRPPCVAVRALECGRYCRQSARQLRPAKRANNRRRT